MHGNLKSHLPVISHFSPCAAVGVWLMSKRLKTECQIDTNNRTRTKDIIRPKVIVRVVGDCSDAYAAVEVEKEVTKVDMPAHSAAAIKGGPHETLRVVILVEQRIAGGATAAQLTVKVIITVAFV